MDVTEGDGAQLELAGGPARESAAPGEPDAARSLHRRTDSAGSREAARYRATDESRHARDAAIFEALRRRPWQTSLELFTAEAELLTGAGVHDRTDLARRLPILLRHHLVSRIDPDRYPTVKPCRAAGSPCFRWALAGAPGAEDWLGARSHHQTPAPVESRRFRTPKRGRCGPTVANSAGELSGGSQGARVGIDCERCDGRGWVLGSDGVARPCACRPPGRL